MKSPRLRVGNKVMWRGCFGGDEPKEAKVTMIEICATGQKEGGYEVSSVKWDTVTKTRTVIVVLDNGHWAYGKQISPISN